MLIAIKVLAVFMMTVGVLIFVYPQALKRFLNFAIENRMIYVGGVVRIIIGTFLLINASECKYMWVVVVFGSLLLISGIMFFVLGVERMNSILAKMRDKSDLIHRLMSVVMFGIGILLIVSV